MTKHRPYELEEYNPGWKKRFEDVAEMLRPLFGDNLIEIEHVGSTSIEGMVAKPQIDVLVVVKDLDGVEAVRGDIEDAGFTVQGRGYVADYDYYVTKDAPDGHRLFSIHILQLGTPKIQQYKNFRDYIRENAVEREEYIKLKRELYEAHRDSYKEYDTQKDERMAPMKARAEAWAAART